MACHILRLTLLILCFLASPKCSSAQFDLRLASLPGYTDVGILVLRSSGGEDTGLVCYNSSRDHDHYRLAILVCTGLGYSSNIEHRYEIYPSVYLVSYNIGQQLSNYSFSCDSSSEAQFHDCQFQQTGGNCYDAQYNTNIYAGMTCLGSKITSCADRCDKRLHPHWACQCNNECVRHGNCCSDFLRYCTRPSIRDDGAVVVEEITTRQEVGYVCHGTRFLSQEALVVCKELGFMGMGAWKTLDRKAASTSTVIDSYILCYEGNDTLSDCTFETNPMENDTCPILAGVTCNVTTSTQATTTGDEAASSQSPGTTDGQKYVYITIASVVLVSVLALIFLAYMRRRKNRVPTNSPDPANSSNLYESAGAPASTYTALRVIDGSAPPAYCDVDDSINLPSNTRNTNLEADNAYCGIDDPAIVPSEMTHTYLEFENASSDAIKDYINTPSDSRHTYLEVEGAPPNAIKYYSNTPQSDNRHTYLEVEDASSDTKDYINAPSNKRYRYHEYDDATSAAKDYINAPSDTTQK